MKEVFRNRNIGGMPNEGLSSYILMSCRCGRVYKLEGMNDYELQLTGYGVFDLEKQCPHCDGTMVWTVPLDTKIESILLYTRSLEKEVEKLRRPQVDAMRPEQV